jgi:hypothetical protein
VKFEVDIPALVVARPRGAKSTKSVLCTVPMTLDIRRLSPQDAPVAAFVTRGDGRSPFRYHEGRFLASVGKIAAISGNTDFKRMTRRTQIESTLFGLMDAKLSDKSFDLPPLWPATSRAAVAAGIAHIPAWGKPDTWYDQPAAQISKFPDPIGSLDLSEINYDDVAYWTSEAEHAAERVFLCDDRLWRQVPEPSLIANFVSGYSPYIETAQAEMDIYEYRLHPPASYRSYKRGAQGSAYWGELGNVCYPLTEHDRMQEDIAEFARNFQASQKPKSIGIKAVEVLMPDVFGQGWHDLELDRVARRSAWFVNLSYAKDNGRGEWKKNADPGLHGAYTTLKDMLDTYDPANGLHPDMEAALTQFREHLAAVAQNEREMNRREFLQIANSVWEGLRRWRDRPIEISFSSVFG